MRIDTAELRKGLSETGRFVLSHHVPAEFYRCYSPVVFGRRVHICARCAGVYPGIGAGVLATLGGPEVTPATVAFLVALLPVPSLVDWSVTTFSSRRGYNPVRTVTGFLLGCGYGLAIAHLLFEAMVGLLGIGVGYAILAGILLYYSW